MPVDRVRSSAWRGLLLPELLFLAGAADGGLGAGSGFVVVVVSTAGAPASCVVGTPAWSDFDRPSHSQPAIPRTSRSAAAAAGMSHLRLPSGAATTAAGANASGSS